MQFKTEFGELTEDRKKIIIAAMEDGKNCGYDLRSHEHRYFFVEKFYETDFRKVSPRAPMGTRIFDLTEVLNTDNIPSTKDVAELLKNETWT